MMRVGADWCNGLRRSTNAYWHAAAPPYTFLNLAAGGQQSPGQQISKTPRVVVIAIPVDDFLKLWFSMVLRPNAIR